MSLAVICNDIFSWASADAEDINHSEIGTLHKMFMKDPDWGPAVWCIQKRGLMPQKPVADRIKEAGLWDLDSMNLKKNG